MEAEAFYLVDAKSVYATNPEAIKLARDLEKLCELYNSLNERTGGQLLAASPWTFNHFRGTFVLSQKTLNGLYVIEPNLDFLRKELQRAQG